MRIQRRKEEDEGLPLTPLIDVVFLLLIFFLTATSFHKKERDIKVDPPKATEGKAHARRDRERDCGAAAPERETDRSHDGGRSMATGAVSRGTSPSPRCDSGRARGWGRRRSEQEDRQARRR